MDDYIERKAAIEKLNAYCELRMAISGENDEFLRGLKVALEAIKYSDVIPSADAQPVKRSKWDEYVCQNCNVSADYFISGNEFYFDEKPHFCPNCGADMRKESEDNA